MGIVYNEDRKELLTKRKEQLHARYEEMGITADQLVHMEERLVDHSDNRRFLKRVFYMSVGNWNDMLNEDYLFSILTFGDIAVLNQADLKKSRGFGPGCFEELERLQTEKNCIFLMTRTV